MPNLKELIFLAAVSLVATVSWAVPSAHGSGFGVFTQGASALGQADAVVAHSDGPSAIFFNPALISRLPGTQLEVGTTLILPHRDFSASDGTTATARETLVFPSTFYLTHAFNDKFSAGLGVFNPFGLRTDWGGDWQGRFITTKSELQTVNIRPVVTYRIAPSLSVAMGMDIVLLDATLESKVPSTALGIPGASFDVARKFSGSGNGLGYNLGILFDVNDAVSIGASYRSEVKIDIDGDLSLSVSPQSISAKTSITLPQQVFAGVAYRPAERFVIEMGMRWEDWSSFDQLKIDIAGQPPAVFPRDWHGTFAVNAGGKYRLNDTVSLLAGYLYGWNPVPDSTFEPAITGSNSHLFSVGGEAHFNRLKVALAYAYQLQEERTKTTNLYGPIANGTYNSDLHLLGLSAGYSF
jgi:long-chain fatty acid transport protein